MVERHLDDRQLADCEERGGDRQCSELDREERNIKERETLKRESH